jgi:Sulfotransferase domain
MKTPNFIVVGAHKAGTSSLHAYLNQHPEIYLPPNKGLDLLYRRRFKELDEAGEYLAQFEGAEPGQILGEVSSVYLHRGREFVEKIKHLFPEVKIIAVLRNPIDRAYSNALWDRSYTQDEIHNLDQLIMTSEQFLIPGLYYTHLKNYFSCFDRDQVKILLYEDFVENPHAFFAELFGFIGVDQNFSPDMSKRLHSGSLQLSGPYRNLLMKGYSISSSVKLLVPKAMRKFLRKTLYEKSRAPKPSMSNKLRLELINYFHDEVTNLKQLTGLDVSHWLNMPESKSG